jgi:RHH-type proline utilization regulon transcriptional repressor/proline dehydrogenase/delta 1-pyrroline-5-carboxylate dehydrogenase
MGKSALGLAMKAGGSKYTAQFMEFESAGLPANDTANTSHPLLDLSRRWQQLLDEGEFKEIESDIKSTIRTIYSYLYHVENEFSRQLDYFQLRGQDNILRYLPVGTVVVRLHEEDSLFEALARIAAVKITGCKLRISSPKGLDALVTRFLTSTAGRALVGNVSVVYERDEELIKSMPKIDRIRYAAPARVPQDVLSAAAETGFYIARTPVTMDGRIELLQYYRQQSICNNYHRYGNLGERAKEFESK